MTGCLARIVESPWYIHWRRCAREAKYEPLRGLALCGTHLKVYERWQKTRTEEQLLSMIEFHWRLKVTRK